MLSNLTDPAAVEAALQEFDQKGRDQFLAESNYKRSQKWFVKWNDRLYDSKPIAGRAVQLQDQTVGRLEHDAFSGGEPVRRRLEKLGFEVVAMTKR